jgi:hypothetical protein
MFHPAGSENPAALPGRCREVPRNVAISRSAGRCKIVGGVSRRLAAGGDVSPDLAGADMLEKP